MCDGLERSSLVPFANDSQIPRQMLRRHVRKGFDEQIEAFFMR